MSPCPLQNITVSDGCPIPVPIINGTASSCYTNACSTWGPANSYDNVYTGINSLTVTSYTLNPWVTFQLNSIRSDVSAVEVWARSDALYASQSQNLAVYISSTPNFASGVLCGSNISARYAGEGMLVDCPVTQNVQYVTIQRNTLGARGYLAFQEVQVYRDGK